MSRSLPGTVKSKGEICSTWDSPFHFQGPDLHKSGIVPVDQGPLLGTAVFKRVGTVSTYQDRFQGQYSPGMKNAKARPKCKDLSLEVRAL